MKIIDLPTKPPKNMKYTGKLYGKIGRRIILLTLTSEDVNKLEKENLQMKNRIAALQYWRDISECDCSSPLPQGGCLRCDIDKLLLLANMQTPNA